VRRLTTGKASAVPDLATLEAEVAAVLLDLQWRRRESNPRPRPYRTSIYKLRPPFGFARRPVCDRPTDGLALLRCRAAGEWLSLGAEPAS